MIIVSSGLWLNQAPGAESVAGLCLLLRPGRTLWRVPGVDLPEYLPPDYTIDLLVTFEHPVDTRQRSFQQAAMLALTDLPPSRSVSAPEVDLANARARTRGEHWMKNPGAPGPGSVTPTFPLLSRVRRWQGGWEPEQPDERRRWGGRLYEKELNWKANALEPETVIETAGFEEPLALAQAALLFP